MINYHHQNRLLCYDILLTLITHDRTQDYGSTPLKIGVLKKPILSTQISISHILLPLNNRWFFLNSLNSFLN